MRVIQAIATYPPADFYTGPPHQVHRLCRELRTLGVDVRVITTNANGPATIDVPPNRWTELDGVPVYYGARIPGTDQQSWSSWRTMMREAPRSDLVHCTGLFSWVNVTSGLDRPVVISPRGSLDAEALGYSAAKKAWFFRLVGRRSFRHAAAFHVTSEAERGHVERFVPGSRTRLIPNGVEIPSDAELLEWRSGPAVPPTIVFLGRIHPKKNVPTLVRAFSAIAPRHPGARLVLAGPDDKQHRAEVVREIQSTGIGGSVDLAGTVSGRDKSALLARAAALVLPSTTENFGNVVAEALAHAVPVIASTGTPWSALAARDCGSWIEPSVTGLAAAMDRLLSTDPGARTAMGRRGRQWMIEEFSWPRVARAMSDFYEELASA